MILIFDSLLLCFSSHIVLIHISKEFKGEEKREGSIKLPFSPLLR
nr:MAG TPA: hypothetical protein [Bacteriophage sp.]